jgi:hypothetical protein
LNQSGETGGSADLLDHSQENSSSESHLARVIELELASLRFLLEDFHSKLKNILAPKKRATFLPTVTAHNNNKSSATVTSFEQLKPSSLAILKEIFPALCTHLERVAQKLLSNNDEDMVRFILFPKRT